jgi:hypothetical protein
LELHAASTDLCLAVVSVIWKAIMRRVLQAVAVEIERCARRLVAHLAVTSGAYQLRVLYHHPGVVGWVARLNLTQNEGRKKLCALFVGEATEH